MVVIRMVSAPYFRCQLPTVNGPSHGLAFKTLPGKGASLLRHSRANHHARFSPGFNCQGKPASASVKKISLSLLRIVVEISSYPRLLSLTHSFTTVAPFLRVGEALALTPASSRPVAAKKGP